VYVDTGVFIAAVFPSTVDSDAARVFCNELIAAGSRVYTSQVARLDLARALRKLATKPGRLPEETRRAYDLDQWATNPLIRSRWLWHSVRQFERLVSQFDQYAELAFSMDVWHQSLDLMAAETLDSSDAMHLATARLAGLTHFATTDSDFRRIPSPQVLLIRDARLQ
jgi:predicted nucleic acid-binding protein